MELEKIPFFSVVKKRMAWLSQRQEVLAQNIANADTPGYKARDLKAFKFKDLVRSENANLMMKTTEGNHLRGQRRRIRDFRDEVIRDPAETDTSGNSVILEEQMVKMNETSLGYRMTTELYKKHLNMIKMAIGRR